MCFRFGLYDFDRFGSEVFAIGLGCEERYSGLMASWPAVGWCDGMVIEVECLELLEAARYKGGGGLMRREEKQVAWTDICSCKVSKG